MAAVQQCLPWRGQSPQFLLCQGCSQVILPVYDGMKAKWIFPCWFLQLWEELRSCNDFCQFLLYVFGEGPKGSAGIRGIELLHPTLPGSEKLQNNEKGCFSCSCWQQLWWQRLYVLSVEAFELKKLFTDWKSGKWSRPSTVLCCSRANIPGAETVFSNKLPRKHNFSNTFKVNIQHQSNICTSVQKVKKRSKAIFLQLLMEVTLLHYLFPLANHWSKEDDSVVGFWMSYQKPRHDWDSETGSS